MSFHLFRLPESIYIDIINTMNPCEQFFTSLCSRKAYSIIKSHRQQIKHSRLCIKGNRKFDFGHYVETFLTFHQSSEPSNQKLEELMIDGNTIPYELKEEKVFTTYWEEPIVGTMELIEYVCDLFNIEIMIMEIYCDSGDRLMKWAQRRQKCLDIVVFTSSGKNRFTPETLTSLIMSSEAKEIRLNAYTTQPFQIRNFQKRCDCFYVFIGAWFTLENLMTLDCIDITDIILLAGNVCGLMTQNAEPLIIGQVVEDSKQKEMVSINGKSARFAYDNEQSMIITFWAEPIVGTMELVKHVTSLFGIQVDRVLIKSDSGTRFMNWVQSRQKFLPMVKVNSYDSMFKSEDLKNIIMECEADHIQLNALHSSPFQIQNLNKKFELFECLRGTWITVDNLMTLDCVSITVEERWFTNAEMNRFIKHWMNGGSNRLKALRVVIADLNLLDLFVGLGARWNVEKMVVLKDNLIEFSEFFEVVRSDGITAGFKFFPSFFWFGVWPKDNENVLYLDSF
uniref:F-box domain-containing protein n=1 Tax=Caenorhabditis tropicalis TaxID=1561998 RepID=A0A1I7UN01_9PELO